MKPAPFAYQRPASLRDAVAALSGDEGITCVAVAGGQSLMPMLALRVAPADMIIDIGRLPELKAVEPIDGGLRIGAGVTHADIEDGNIADPTGGLMRKVAAGIAYRAVRNHGTIGGSVALADPAADWPACLLALGALVRINGPGGERAEAMDAFLQGAYSTSLQPGEIITAFDVPTLGKARFGHAKVVRKSGAFAMSIGCVVRRNANDVTAVLGGTTTRASLLPALAKVLSSPTAPSEHDLRSAFAADLAAIEPEADAYTQRLHTATILRAVKEATA
jgi:carbon-monoxide dehydrogenase medium subunit